MPQTHALTRQQLITLVVLTLVWGMNWPILKIGVTSAWWLGEVLHWQDGMAVWLVVAAIASVLWPAKNT